MGIKLKTDDTDVMSWTYITSLAYLMKLYHTSSECQYSAVPLSADIFNSFDI